MKEMILVQCSNCFTLDTIQDIGFTVREVK